MGNNPLTKVKERGMLSLSEGALEYKSAFFYCGMGISYSIEKGLVPMYEEMGIYERVKRAH